jgi:Zn-finger nucleic acid-binding protein
MYRDEREKCPRGHGDLTSAGVAGTCTQCNGIWLHPGSLEEMVAQMQIPPENVGLTYATAPRDKLACPSCHEPMDARLLYGVELDLCTKHGVWFDAQELALVLLRAAKPS